MRRFFLILAVSLVIALIVITYFGLTSFTQDSCIPDGTPVPHPLPLISIIENPQHVNVTQGMSFSVNLTITSIAVHDLSIPLSLSDLYVIRDGSGLVVVPEDEGFTFGFEPKLLIIKPSGSNSSILNVEIAENATIGEYRFMVLLENWEETNVGGTTIFIDVLSK